MGLILGHSCSVGRGKREREILEVLILCLSNVGESLKDTIGMKQQYFCLIYKVNPIVFEVVEPA